MLHGLSYAKLLLSRKFSLPKDMKALKKCLYTCSCKLNSCKRNIVKPHLVLNNLINVCDLMYITDSLQIFIPRHIHCHFFSVGNKRLNFPVSHMEPGCVGATEQRTMAAFLVLNPYAANICIEFFCYEAG